MLGARYSYETRKTNDFMDKLRMIRRLFKVDLSQKIRVFCEICNDIDCRFHAQKWLLPQCSLSASQKKWLFFVSTPERLTNESDFQKWFFLLPKWSLSALQNKENLRFLREVCNDFDCSAQSRKWLSRLCSAKTLSMRGVSRRSERILAAHNRESHFCDCVLQSKSLQTSRKK